jgi:hypothetical protein
MKKKKPRIATLKPTKGTDKPFNYTVYLPKPTKKRKK